ncbi:MAG TPA: AI-2E family transporter [Candidatus Limnocylindria bacterium]|nr:AI-2E family transporter [Candidatus Limnocylindria bacterium]
MKYPGSVNLPGLEDKTFVLLIIAVSLAFAWILWPYSGAIFWATVLAIVFAPLYRRLSTSMRQRHTLAALVSVMIVLMMVIVPFAFIAASLVQEGFSVYERIKSGDLDIGRYLKQLFGVLPAWVMPLLDRLGLTNVSALQERLSTGLMQGSQFIATQAFNIGQNTFNFIVNLFVMLYLLFFLLRDGDALAKKIKEAIPLRAEQQRDLFDKFNTVIRATVKGNIVVALVQGALGGLIFWFLGVHAAVLWGVVMAFLSLLPAVGAGLVWFPVAIYFLLTGATWQGVILIAYGVLVIGLVDNILRPILVGKDTKMPDYIVLIATLGGMAIFGLNGFVVGPVIAAMFMAVWGIFSDSRSGN